MKKIMAVISILFLSQISIADVNSVTSVCNFNELKLNAVILSETSVTSDAVGVSKKVSAKLVSDDGIAYESLSPCRLKPRGGYHCAFDISQEVRLEFNVLISQEGNATKAGAVVWTGNVPKGYTTTDCKTL